MAIQDDSTVLCKGDLKAYHESILPYLGGNMVLSTNVSDYYSTDEKIVGVWTDGKPLYQKTYIGNTPSSSGGVLCSIFSLDTLVWAGGIVIHSSGHILPVPQANTEIYGYETTNNISFAANSSSPGWYNRPCHITLQYTKTTDTANSAVTTPGCYDINFPNTWPENTEVYFGNGLYGQRFTGTATAKANVAATVTLYSGANTIKIYNCGGWCTVIDPDETMPLFTSWDGNYWSGIDVDPTSGIFMKTISSHARSNSPYDVWVKYTK